MQARVEVDEELAATRLVGIARAIEEHARGEDVLGVEAEARAGVASALRDRAGPAPADSTSASAICAGDEQGPDAASRAAMARPPS